MLSKVVSVVEAAYSVERPEVDWLAAIASAAEAAMGRGLGTCAYVYDAARAPVRVGTIVQGSSLLTAAFLRASAESAPESYIEETWRSISFGTASQGPGFAEIPAVREIFWPLGIRDLLVLNAYDPSGIGVWVGAPLPKLGKVKPADVTTWTRIATHLAAAFRLRQQMKGAVPIEHATAVLSPSGSIEHATGRATTTDARASLRSAVARMERARGPMRSRDPAGAIETWRVLVEGQWSLLDHFERGGRRYVVAVENPSRALGPDVLTARERQVVAGLVAGHTNKVIAYEMGLSDSTVRVLVSRCTAKLRVRTRRELVALYRAHARANREAR